MSHPERGSALVLILFLLMVVALLALGVVATATTDLKVSDNYVQSVRNLYAADAGANHAVAILQSDPSSGDYPPYPTGTPYTTGTLGELQYSLWLWNQRVSGNGTVEDFNDEETRQFVADGSDGRGATRRVSGIIEPARRPPKALDYAIFTCGALTLDGKDDKAEGDVYAAGNVLWDAECRGDGVDIYSRGEVTNTEKVKGTVYANGAIHNNNGKKIEGQCITASNTIDKTSNCDDGFTKNVVPAPVKEWCNNLGADYDPKVLDFTTAETDEIEDQTPLANKHLAGWTVAVGPLVLGDAFHYVTGGSCNFNGIDVTYSGNTVLLVDGANFTCDGCKIVAAGGAPAWANISIITTDGNILFTAAATTKWEMSGVLWAGVVDAAGNRPANGSITVAGKAQVEIEGTVVAVSGPVSSTGANAELRTYVEEVKPSIFGDPTGFAITEWREAR